MPTIFLGTEAYEGMGHIAPWRNFVRLATHNAHSVHMATPDVGVLEGLMSSELAANIWQAPRPRCDVNPAYANPKSWPELMLALGYGNATQLAGVAKAWVNLLVSSGADLVIADYAPGLHLAAKVLGLPLIEAGGGFCVPPLSPVQYFPGVCGRNPVFAEDAEAILCSTFNAVLKQSGSADVLGSLADYAGWAAHRVVLSAPQMDHYGERADVIYLGNLGTPPITTQALQNFSGVQLPASIIGYFKPTTRGLPALVDQLAEAGKAAWLFVPGADPLLGRDRVRIFGQPLDFSQVLPQADIYLSNGGLHGVCQALHHGCWPVVMPMQAEQVAMARNLVRHQLGDVWLPESSASITQFRKVFSVRRKAPKPASPIDSAEKRLLAIVEKLVACDTAKRASNNYGVRVASQLRG